MIALALLGMAASILVCYLAARVGARVGRDIRGNVFRKVVGFPTMNLTIFLPHP